MKSIRNRFALVATTFLTGTLLASTAYAFGYRRLTGARFFEPLNAPNYHWADIDRSRDTELTTRVDVNYVSGSITEWFHLEFSGVGDVDSWDVEIEGIANPNQAISCESGNIASPFINTRNPYSINERERNPLRNLPQARINFNDNAYGRCTLDINFLNSLERQEKILIRVTSPGGGVRNLTWFVEPS